MGDFDPVGGSPGMGDVAPAPRDHGRYRELAATALDFELDPEESAALEAHLATCEACRAFAAALRGDTARIAALPGLDAPRSVAARIDAATGRAPKPRADWRPRAIMVAVIVLGVVPLGLSVVLGGLRFGLGGAAGPPGPAATAGTAWTLAAIGIGAEPSSPPGTFAPTPPASGAPTQPPDRPAPASLAAAAARASLGFVAVGHACLPDSAESCSAAVLASTDGLGWAIVGGPFGLTPLPGGRQAGMTDVTAGGAGFVAVGTEGSSDDDRVSPRAVIWVSDVGDTGWTRVADAPELAGAWMWGVTLAEGRLVAVGGATDEGPGGTPRVAPAAWTSDDGLTWRRVASDAFVAGSPGPLRDGRDSAGMWDVAAGGAGIVAVGAACDGTACHGVAWHSADGETWQRSEPFGAGLPTSVVAQAGGMVAVGSTGGRAAAWHSTDGLTWLPAKLDTASGGPVDGTLRTVVVDGNRLLAGGTGSAAGLWTSPDGQSWSALREPALVGRAIHALTAAGPSAVAVGVGPEGGPAIWVRRAVGDEP